MSSIRLIAHGFSVGLLSFGSVIGLGAAAAGCTADVEGLSGGSSAPAGLCDDGLKTGEESDVDCGGSQSCSPCSDGLRCNTAADCSSKYCNAGVCATPTCSDGVKNQSETDVDCGADCRPCKPGLACAENDDCAMAGTCTSGVCSAAGCKDGLRNQDESDVDCGGSCRAQSRCAMGKRCVVASDCDSFICNAGECIADDPVAATDIIDDMEDGDNKIAPIGARSGVWYAFNDKSGGTQAPLGAVNGERIPDGGRGESRFAMHTSGGGFTQWGSGIGFDFNNPNGGEATKLPYDATGYSGIRLWARAAEEQPLRMTVPDVRTDPAGNLCSDTEKGCDDHFGVLLQVGTEWRRFDVPFATLRQQGFGNPEPDGLAIGDLLGVHFQVPANSDFDFWIDDVSLY